MPGASWRCRPRRRTSPSWRSSPRSPTPSARPPRSPAGLAALPAALRDTIARTRDWLAGPGASAVDAFAAADRALLVSRGFNLATALELALKLKETCGLFAEAYSTADFMHGPLVLARAEVPTLAIRPDGLMGADVDATLAAVAARGGRTTVFGGSETAGRPDALTLPHSLPESLTPLLFVVPGPAAGGGRRRASAASTPTRPTASAR